MKKASSQRGVFKPLQPVSSDIPEVKRIKQRINKIVERELVHHDFKDQLNKEALAGETYNEVITRKNFFFQVDETKKDRNLAVHNIYAPGNKYRHPQVILPHEHVSTQHPIDTTGVDSDKMFELYGYYAYLTDLHIA